MSGLRPRPPRPLPGATSRRRPPLRATRWKLALLGGVGWLVLALAAGCGGGGEAAAPSAGGDVGAACSPSLPCLGHLVCLDGLCRERPWPPGPVPPPVRVPDVTWPPVEPPLPDVADEDAAGPDADDDAAEDGGGPDAGPTDAGPADAAGDADAAPDTGGGQKIVLLIGEDDVDAAPGEVLAVLEPGQAWVTELTLPLPGDILGMEAFLANVSGPASCARFRPAVWLPGEGGAYPDLPTWTSPELQALQPVADGAVFLLPETLAVPAGTVRIGLVYEQPCDGGPPAPALLSDTSGDQDRTWIWAPQPEAAPWIPAWAVGIEGRWGLRVLIEVIWQ